MKMNYRPNAFDNQCIAEITVKRNTVKKYNNQCYLKNGQEFEILLGNNTTDVVIATISMNGKRISTKGIVLKPGQKIFLERYLDDNKKFLFETYTVDNTAATQAAIANNGNIEVSFYREKQSAPTYPNYTSNIRYYTDPHNIWFNQNELIGNSVNTSYTTNSLYSSGQTPRSLKSRVCANNLETGRIEKGSTSKQDFSNYNGDFETSPFKTISLKVLPFSSKPLEAKDLAEYCTECGTKNRKGNYKFCPKCGNKF